METPRIAYLTGAYPTVSHTFILREVAALRALGFDVRTCSIRRTDPDVHHRGPEEREAAASTFYVLAEARRPMAFLAAQLAAMGQPRRWLRAVKLAWRTRPAGARALLYQGFYLAEAAVLCRHLLREGATHLHNHFADSSCSVAMLASEMSGIPFSFTMHGPLELYDAPRWRFDVKVARARFVACISNYCRSQMMLFSDPEHWGKLSIVHCGVDPARYDRPRGEPGQHVVFVGRLAAMKGVPLLIDAFAQVLVCHPGARLTLVGDGPERPLIEARAEALGIGANLTFAGFRNQEEVAELLAEADVFALPSFAEGVPVVLMEAMASRRPVVATRVAGVGELVEDGVSGTTVPPGDACPLAEAIAALLDNPERARAMGDAGRQRVCSEYDSAREAARLGALLQPAG
ncbi:glycosyltransferase [Aliiruegeria haliotis]|uniref:glycosyltransferase n=1 Tax=Aliiruegeria haliotis TaxID=1280846 RepID=UPI000D068048